VKSFWQKVVMVTVCLTIPLFSSCNSGPSTSEVIRQSNSYLRNQQPGLAEQLLEANLRRIGYDSTQENDRALLAVCLGNSYLQETKFDAAQSAYEEARSICERKFGPNSLEVAAPLSGLTTVYERRHMYAEAENLARETLAVLDQAVREHRIAKDDERIEKAINSILAVACRSGHCQDELELYSRLVEVRTRSLGPDHKFTGAARQMLAEAYVHSKKYDEAIALLKTNVESARKTDPHTLPIALDNLAGALSISGDPKAAMRCVTDAEGLQNLAPNSYYPQQLLTTLRLKAQILFDLGLYPDAVIADQELLSKAKAMLGGSTPVLADYYVMLSDSLKKTGKLSLAAQAQQEAERLYKGR
jgi:cytochrome c-type biogenesis protein CcmH/NrfG